MFCEQYEIRGKIVSFPFNLLINRSIHTRVSLLDRSLEFLNAFLRCNKKVMSRICKISLDGIRILKCVVHSSKTPSTVNTLKKSLGLPHKNKSVHYFQFYMHYPSRRLTDIWGWSSISIGQTYLNHKNAYSYFQVTLNKEY